MQRRRRSGARRRAGGTASGRRDQASPYAEGRARGGAGRGRQRRIPVGGISEIRPGISRQGPGGYLRRSIQSQQGQQRERRPEMDPEGWRLLQRMQQAAERRRLIEV